MASLISELSYLFKKLEEIEKHLKINTLTPNEKRVFHTIVELKTKNNSCNITDVVELVVCLGHQFIKQLKS